jgi:hypothetical protein
MKANGKDNSQKGMVGVKEERRNMKWNKTIVPEGFDGI